jgi:2-polyprenyl-6-methoxyphenol hydroxylase-like FAD-dependent oxidoreductase
MQDTRDNRVMIIGGGLGGLAAAIALQRVGIAATVFERAPELREIGGGVTVWTPGMKALKQLGADAAVLATGTSMESFEFRSWRGDVLVQVPLGELGRKHGAPNVLVRRADLHSALLAQVDQSAVQLGAECIGFEQDDTGVTARFGDGREERGSVLVGADGIRSVIRMQMRSESAPRFAGYQYLRGITEFDDPTLPMNSFWMLWGSATRFGIGYVGYPRVYWFAVVNAEEGEGDAPIGRKRELLERFRGWARPVEALIEHTEESAIGRTDVQDIEPMRRWGRGRVTLLGDAAHCTTPNMGRGANEAIEDAVVLASCLAGARDLRDRSAVVPALRAYEARRMGPTAMITNASRRVGQIARWGSPVVASLREGAMKLVASRAVPRVMEAQLKREI